MSDSNPEKDQLETLQQMLEAEMRGHSEPSEAPAKPAPPVAKPDDLGSLLGDLLSEAEKEVGRDRPDGTETGPGSAPEVRTASDRVPTQSLERDDASQPSRHDTEDLSSTVQDTRPNQQSARSAERSNRKTMIMAAAAVIAAAAAFAFLTQPKPEMALPDIGQRVGDTISRASLKWQTQEAKRQVEEARLLVEEAKKAEAAAKKKAAEATKAADAAKASELAQAQEAQKQAADEDEPDEAKADEAKTTKASKKGSKSKSKNKRRAGKRRRGKKLRIKTNVF